MIVQRVEDVDVPRAQVRRPAAAVGVLPKSLRPHFRQRSNAGRFALRPGLFGNATSPAVAGRIIRQAERFADITHAMPFALHDGRYLRVGVSARVVSLHGLDDHRLRHIRFDETQQLGALVDGRFGAAQSLGDASHWQRAVVLAQIS